MSEVKLDVRFQDETAWLTQALMAELFQIKPQNITMHLKNILVEVATCKELLQVQIEGNRQFGYKRKFYNLDASATKRSRATYSNWRYV